MNKKIIFQIFLYFLIFFFISLLVFQYSYDEKPKDTGFSENNIDLNSNTNTSSNTMSNIEYKSTDTIGNQYLIRAKLGSISDENSNVILMQDVEAEIQLDNSEKILISALSAEYNIVNYDTIFSKNVIVTYPGHKITGEYLDFSLLRDLGTMSTNVIYTGNKNELFADMIEMNISTKDTKIFMNDNKKDVIIKGSN